MKRQLFRRKRKKSVSGLFFIPDRCLILASKLIEFHKPGPGKSLGQSMPYALLAKEKSKSAISKDIKILCEQVVRVCNLPYPPIYRVLCKKIDFHRALLKVIKDLPRNRMDYMPRLSAFKDFATRRSIQTWGRNELDTDGDPVGIYTKEDREIDDKDRIEKEMLQYFNIEE